MLATHTEKNKKDNFLYVGIGNVLKKIETFQKPKARVSEHY